jgi:hypothetical protein
MKTVEWLRQMLEMKAKMRTPEGWKFKCTEDFVLFYGRSMKRNKNNGVKCGEPKQCFDNAFRLAGTNPLLTYCEGYATTSKLPFPVEHAWCVNKKGEVIDPTWKDGKDYFGVEIPFSLASEIIIKQKQHGVIDSWKLGFPLLSGDINFDEWRAK